MGAMTATFTLPDAIALGDLTTYLGRADRIDRASTRLVAESGVLAVYTAVLYPAGLLDQTPTVLGLRTVAVGEDQRFDAVVPIASLAERLRRVEESPRDAGAPVDVGMPAEVNTVTWAGVAPPRSGWQSVDQTRAGLLVDVANAGIAEVAQSVPAGTGEQLVQRVRSEVWSRPIPGLEHVPAGAAFAAFTLGFVPDLVEQIPIYESGPWTRLSTERGHVLVKRKAWSLSTGPIGLV